MKYWQPVTRSAFILKLNAITAFEKMIRLSTIAGFVHYKGGRHRFWLHLHCWQSGKFCNHISALMLKVCKFTLFELKTTKDLQEENNENPVLACTSQLQKWNKKVGGENIVPQPVMEVNVKKT